MHVVVFVVIVVVGGVNGVGDGFKSHCFLSPPLEYEYSVLFLCILVAANVSEAVEGVGERNAVAHMQW